MLAALLRVIGPAVFALITVVVHQYNLLHPQPIQFPASSTDTVLTAPTNPIPFGIVSDSASSSVTHSGVVTTPKVLPVVSTKPKTQPTSPLPSHPPVVRAPTPAATPTISVPLSGEALLKSAIVNVICIPGGGVTGVSGSGVIIDPRGIVLTVAHIGQNFLLRDYPTSGAGTCYLRTGSPAKNAYRADLIFVSPSWIAANKKVVLSLMPTGTGENDFAILAITKSITSSPLPSSFPYIPLADSPIEVRIGEEVGTGSYAAEFLSSSEVRSSLFPTIKFAPVSDVRTFESGSEDIVSVAAGSAAQEGSSGGAVINTNNKLIGIISTRSVRPNVDDRILQAISVDHIRASFESYMHKNLDSYLEGSPGTLVANFKDRAVGLLDILREVLDCAKTGTNC